MNGRVVEEAPAGRRVLPILIGLVTLVVLLILIAPGVTSAAGINDGCLICHGKTDFKVERDGESVSLFVDPATLKASTHAPLSCTSCHGLGIPHDKLSAEQVKAQVSASCQACHSKQGAEYKDSIHGKLAAQGVTGAAYCQDCHGKHDIKKVVDPASLATKTNSTETCLSCHGDIRKSYEYSFHGTALKLGYTRAASCTDCHGAHGILGPSDPNSMVAKANIPTTCSKCHGQALPNFAEGKEHVTPDDKKNAFPLWIVWKIFLALILFDVTQSSSIVILELLHKLRHLKHAAH